MKAPPLPTLRFAIGGILVIGVLTRVLGLLREMIIAGQFGTSGALDALFLGLAFPLAVCVGVGGGISRAIVPVGAALSTRALGRVVARAALRYCSALLVLATILAIAAPWWTALLSIGASPDLERKVLLTTAVVACFALPGSVLAGLCIGAGNAHGHHVSATSTTLIYNVVVIASLMLGYRTFGVYSLLMGIVLAEYLQTLALLPFLWSLRRVDPGDDGRVAAGSAPELFSLFLPAAVLGATAGLLVTVDRAFAGQLPEGAVSTLSYSERILFLPVGLLGMALAQPLYTRLSRYMSEGRIESYTAVLNLAVRLFLLLGTISSLVVVGFAEALIAILLERGAFTEADTRLTAEALRGYGVAVVFLAMQPLLISAAMSLRRGWWVVGLSVVAVVVNAVLDAMLIRWFGLLGITLATSAVSALMVLALLRICAGSLFADRATWRCAAVALGAALVGVPTILAFRHFFPYEVETLIGRMVWLAGGAATTLAVVGILMGYWLRLEWQRVAVLRSIVARDAESGPGESP